MILIFCAAILDAFQFLLMWVFWGLQAITPVGGGAAGATAGAYYCYNASTGVITGALEGLKCAAAGAVLGAGVSAFAIPLGMILDTVLSLTVGGAILMMLAFEGAFYLDAVLPSFMAETIPLFGFLPFWTFLVWRCLSRRSAQERPSRKGSLSTAFGFVTKGFGAGGLQDKATALHFRRRERVDEDAETTKGNVRSVLSSNRFVQDIRPAVKGAALALLLMVGHVAQAQVLAEPVQYVVSPEVPGPNQSVTIEAQGVGSFLGDSTIAWQKDGKTEKSGVGERTYTFTTGGLGSVTTVRVSIQASDGSTFNKQFVFRPSVVNLVWEADTTTPPLYRGKALYSAGSPLKVIALPVVIINGSRVADASLSYQWSRAGQALVGQSGLGRSTLSVMGDQLQVQEDIGVDVYFGSSVVARGGVRVPATAPQAVFYERDALRGTLYDMALPQGIALNAKEITVVAQPYYVARQALMSGALQYDWTLNGEGIAGPDSARGILTLRQTGDGAGSATLGVRVQNSLEDQLVQMADAALSILFGGGDPGSIFGL